MKVMYIGPDDYMARIKTGDVFDVFDCPVNEYGEVTCHVIINAAGEHLFLELGECVVIDEWALNDLGTHVLHGQV